MKSVVIFIAEVRKSYKIYYSVLGNYYPKRFPSFWEKFNRAVTIGKIASVREVRRELVFQVHHTHLFDWVEGQKGLFLPPSPAETRFVSEIFSIPHFLTLVNQKSLLEGRPCADPFVIARAKVINGCVVTEETRRPNAAKIPNVCDHFGVDCTNLQGFMQREGWTF